MNVNELNTGNGYRGIRIMSNLNFSKDIMRVQNSTADGIGLYRTEFEFMLAGRRLDESEQAERYYKVFEAMGELPVFIRLLDIEEDKSIPAFDKMQKENNSMCSYGAWFLLEHPEVLQEQARAMVSASQNNPLNVVYPMIMDAKQFIRLKAMFLQAVSSIKTGVIRHGPMLELPSACLEARALLRKADFGCIGSNDLIKYLFGIDRDDDGETIPNISHHPILHSLVKSVALTANNEGRPLLFCGELAKDPRNLEWLIASGIRNISIIPASIPSIRAKLEELVLSPIAN